MCVELPSHDTDVPAGTVDETERNARGTPAHEATVGGQTFGNRYKDTRRVAVNPHSKITSLFGLQAVELAITLDPNGSHTLAAVFFLVSTVFVWRSFYAMRIKTNEQ